MSKVYMILTDTRCDGTGVNIEGGTRLSLMGIFEDKDYAEEEAEVMRELGWECWVDELELNMMYSVYDDNNKLVSKGDTDECCTLSIWPKPDDENEEE